jgi:hypothetical protein
MLSDQRKRQGYKRKPSGMFRRAGQGVLALPKPLTLIQKRLIETAVLLGEPDERQGILFQHTILCQTSLPYRPELTNGPFL